MRYLINFAYDGTKYAGYQIQPGKETIQEKLEDVIGKINNGIRKTVQASGRTDKGVHALDQYAHVDLDIDIIPNKLKRAMNTYLPDDIHVKDVIVVPSTFHARYAVVNKEYQYFLNMGEYNPIEKDYVFQYNYKLDVDKMIDAIAVFEGKHDFRAFVSENSKKDDCIREIKVAKIKRVNNKIIFIFKGNGFMKYQVRNMVGSLIKVGEGKINKDDLLRILESKDRSKGGATAPANGLFLTKVEYK